MFLSKFLATENDALSLRNAFFVHYTLVNDHIAGWKWIRLEDVFPMENEDIPASYAFVYQRVASIKIPETLEKRYFFVSCGVPANGIESEVVGHWFGITFFCG